MTNSTNPSFIPKERGALPRILLLDFDEQVVQRLTENGYTVFAGHTGLGAMPFMLPKHESELEIVFWDTSTLLNDQKIRAGGAEHLLGSPQGARVLEQVVQTLKRYFVRMRADDGFVGIILSETQSNIANSFLSDALDTDFSFFGRRTTSLELVPHGEDDLWYEFFRRFVADQNIKYGIEWHSNYVGLQRYFSDEDDKWYAVYFHHLALMPKIEDSKMADALTFLLQDILPGICDGDAFPEKYYYRWANKDIYLPPKVQELKKENERIASEAEQQINKNKAFIESELSSNEYLSNMLIADDSELFPENKKLSSCVHKVLENDFKFKVTNVDAMRLQVGESLKEDKWIEDSDGFFALVEIKGTERGAKANWVRSDLNAHIREFEVVKDIKGLQSLLIFNHERRVEPESRNAPFNGDSDLIEYCKKSGIRLVSVYDLFKMARDIKSGVITSEEARKMLKESSGFFLYQNE